MKKVLLIILTICVTVPSIHAQVSIGPKIGYNISKISHEKNHGWKPGPALGVSSNLQLSPLFSLQTELYYISKGNNGASSIHAGNTIVPFITTKRHNYIELPVMAKFSYGTNLVKGYVNVGLAGGYFLGGSWKTTYQGSTTSARIVFVDDKKSDIEGIQYDKDYTNRIEASFVGGIGASLSVGPGSIFIESRYHQGLTNIQEKYAGTGEKVKNKNRVIGCSIGYLFTLQSSPYGKRRR